MQTTLRFSLLVFTLFVRLNAVAQSKINISDSTGKKIKEVENDIFPEIETEGDKPMSVLQRMAFYKIHGLSIAVIHNYKIEWAKGYGMADDSLHIPVTTQTLFQAGSVSKSLNAVGILKLVQNRKIDLYTDINTYLTSWKFPYDSMSKDKKITVANLLSHTAGLTVHGFPGYQNGTGIPTIVQVLNGQKPANSPRIHSMYQPGLKYEYSGGGTTISQLMVMDITHLPYDKYMYDEVLRPLGMTSSTYQQPPINIKPELLAAAYFENGKAVPGKFHTYPEKAAAGLWTNPTDLAKYIIETQLAFQGKSDKVLNQQTTQLRLTPYIDKNAALGVFIDDYGAIKYFEHGGSDWGFQTQYYGSIEGGNGVVVMVNSDDGRIMSEIISSVARVYGLEGLNRTKLRKITTVADSVLKTYTGNYEIEPGFILTVTLEGNQLMGKANGQEKLRLFPETQTMFYLKEGDIQIEFIEDNKGVISKAKLYQNGVHEIKKIK